MNDRSTPPPIIDREAARARLLARFADETAGPPNGTEVALRCTEHGRFLLWVNPPVPPCTVGCGPECADDDQAAVCAVCRRPGGHIVLSHDGPDGSPAHPECLTCGGAVVEGQALGELSADTDFGPVER